MMLNRKIRTARIDVMLRDSVVDSSTSVQNILCRMIEEAFARFAENHRKGNRSMLDWRTTLGVQVTRNIAQCGYLMRFTVGYVLVPRKHWLGRKITFSDGAWWPRP